MLWDPKLRETEEELVSRVKEGIEEIISREWKQSTCALKGFVVLRNANNINRTVVSITCHSGTLRAVQRVLRYPRVWVPTGGTSTEITTPLG